MRETIPPEYEIKSNISKTLELINKQIQTKLIKNHIHLNSGRTEHGTVSVNDVIGHDTASVEG